MLYIKLNGVINLDKKLKSLFKQAQQLKEKAYCPYSKFHVAALVVLKDGTVVEGVNVENVAYGSTICAERNALFHTKTLGYQKDDIDFMLITSDLKDPISPCGSCRQVMNELCHRDMKVYLFDDTGKNYKLMTMEELLPFMY